MKKVEQDFAKLITRSVKSHHRFEDLKGSIDFKNVPPVKVVNKKKIIVGSSIGGAVLALGLTAAIIVVNYFTPHFPALKLENYRVNLTDAEGIGIVPLEANKKSVLAKKNKNTGELEAINFYKKNKPNNKASRSSNALYDSFDDLAAEQNKLGWTIRNYLVIDGGYTLVQFVPKPEYFKSRNGENYCNWVISPHSGEQPADETSYRIDDFDVNHYYNNKYSLFDSYGYSWSRSMKSYIIDNNSGLIYTAEFVNDYSSVVDEDNTGMGLGRLYYYNNILVYVEGDTRANTPPRHNDIYHIWSQNPWKKRDLFAGKEPNVVTLSRDGTNLNVSIANNLPDSLDYFKDRYGQIFGPAMVNVTNTDYEKKIKIVSLDEWCSHFTTTDERFLVIKDNKLYEYADNFELVEVPDGVTYKCSGFYSDYSFINNKYIYNFSKDYFISIKDFESSDSYIENYDIRSRIEGQSMTNALMLLNNEYYLYVMNNKIKCIKDPMSLYIPFLESHPGLVMPMFPDAEVNHECHGYEYSGLGFINQGGYDDGDYESTKEEYKQLLNNNSVSLDDIIKWEFKDAEGESYTLVNVDKELIIYQWTMEGNVPYVVQINDAGEVEYIALDDYSPKEYEFVLTPINL